MKNLILVSLFMFAAQAHAKLESTYTSIRTNCLMHDSASMRAEPEIDFLVEECQGLGGYQVMIIGSDLRYPLSLVYNDKKIELTQIPGFHDIGSDKIEWLYERVTQKDSILKTVNYKALIHRMNYEMYNEKTLDMEQTSALIVTKLDKDKTCPVGIIKKSARMNEEARELAEKVDQLKCQDLGTVEYN